ncbi:protein SENSITIVE TO UV 2 [Apium graveolens]|uniref:protein SENSITIVE TO UV 2 n=1 Tax=Apium graveolens TaxID=4045 RepID=UPI003D7988C1
MNGGEGDIDLDEWTDELMEQLIQVEQQATQHHPQPPQLSTVTRSHSPPPLLSQKFNDKPLKHYDHFSNAPSNSRSSDLTVSSPINHNINDNNTILAVNAKQQEIDRLKRELERASKQITHLEKDCLKLKKERDEREEQLTSVLSRFGAKDAEVQCRDSTDLAMHDAIHDGGSLGVNNQEHPATLLGCKSKNFSDCVVGCQINEGANPVQEPFKSLPSCKAIGVQTETIVDSVNLIIEDDLSTNCQLTRKLLCIWNPTSDELTGRNLVSKLFVACETDFHVLFGYLGFNSSKITVNSLGNHSDVPRPQATQFSQSTEAARISSLYSVLTKITNGLVELETMLQVLIDLCRLDNAVIVYRSLHILHVVLNHLSSVKRRSEKRDNVMVEGPLSVSKSSQTQGCNFSNNNRLFYCKATETSDAVLKPVNPENIFKKEEHDRCSILSSTEVDLISLFVLMQQITVRHHEELVRLEAITIMKIILMKSNAYLERERYAEVVNFHNVSQLLRKDSGLRVQKQAVHLVYLLLNCPPIMSLFCSGCKDEMENAGAAISDTRKASTTQQFCNILEGVADCLPCHGDGTLVLELRRNAIILLAFLVSSGKSGLEILLSHEFSKRTNFLALILKMLVVEMNVEASESIHSSEIFKERTLLIREALIFLNRLVSNAQYSAPVLQVLTNSRDMAFLTIDIANRLSRKGKWLWQSDTVIRNMRESEIASLAQIFKRKVFKFLGYSNASKQN